MQKVCKRCEIQKDEEQFAQATRNKDGRHSYCRSCMSEYRKELRKNWSPERLARHKETQKLSAMKRAAERTPEAIEAIQESKRVWRARVGSEYYRQWRLDHPRQVKSSWLKNHYGITLAEWESMIEEQDHRCRICGLLDPDKWYVDHDHQTKVVRALLCFHCNVLLGFAREDQEILKSAIQYLSDEGLKRFVTG